MALSRTALGAALLAACLAPTGCAAPPSDRLAERLLDRLDRARLVWEPGTGRADGLEAVPAPDGVRVRTRLEAEQRWVPITDPDSWLLARAGDLVVWSFAAPLPTRDPETVALESDRRQLVPWPSPGAAPAYGWFYSNGGFLARGFYLALPAGDAPGTLDLHARFEPSEGLLVDLAGSDGVRPEELESWVSRAGSHRRAIFVPNRSALCFAVEVPAGGRLRMSAGRRVHSWVADPKPSTLEIQWRDGETWSTLATLRFEEAGAAASPGMWSPVDLDLSRLGGRTVELRFRAPDAAGAGRVAHFVADPVVVAPGGSERPPNLVMLVVDGLRADRVLHTGGEPSQTPRLDRLARRGLLFANASTAAPWTRASIASIFTGLLPSAHGVETEAASSRLPRAFPALAEELRRRGYATAALSANPHLDPAFGLARGFSRVDSQLVDGAALERRMEEWVDARDHDPFFLFGFFMDTHFPYADRPDDGSAEAISAQVRNPQRLGRALGRGRRNVSEPTAKEREKLRALYDENVRYTDERVGALLDHLERSGLDRNTIVVVLADHGEAFGEHGDYFHGWNLYRELEHVPLIVAGPSVPRGVRDAPVSLVSLPALLLSILGIEDGPLANADHARALLAGRAAETPVVETRFRDADFAALVSWPWKLLLGRRHGNVELYDLERDPEERTDLAATDPERVARLRAELRARLVGARARRVGTDAEPDEDLTETLEQLRSLGYL